MDTYSYFGFKNFLSLLLKVMKFTEVKVSSLKQEFSMFFFRTFLFKLFMQMRESLCAVGKIISGGCHLCLRRNAYEKTLGGR